MDSSHLPAPLVIAPKPPHNFTSSTMPASSSSVHSMPTLDLLLPAPIFMPRATTTTPPLPQYTTAPKPLAPKPLAPKPVPNYTLPSSSSARSTSCVAHILPAQSDKALPVVPDGAVRSSAFAFSPSFSRTNTALEARCKRKLVVKYSISGHSFFEALAASTKLTQGMSDLQGAQLVRSLYSDFYGISLAKLWPLKSKLNQRERGKCPRYSPESAQAEDAAERCTALATERNLIPTHWAWGQKGYFRTQK